MEEEALQDDASGFCNIRQHSEQDDFELVRRQPDAPHPTSVPANKCAFFGRKSTTKLLCWCVLRINLLNRRQAFVFFSQKGFCLRRHVA